MANPLDALKQRPEEDEQGNQYDRETGALVASASQVRAARGDRSASSFGSGWTPGASSDQYNVQDQRTPGGQPAPVVAPVAPAAGALAGGLGKNKRVGPVPGAPVSATPQNLLTSRTVETGDPRNVLSGIPGTAPGNNVTVAGAKPASFGATDLTEPAQPSAAESAGARVRGAVGGVVRTAANAVGNFFSRASTPGTPPAAGIGGERVDIPAGGEGENALAPIAGFARGLAGRSIASGVSNAQAARIQQPTAANPVPVTDTTPDQHPDESENAITRFGRLPTGLFDNPNTRRKFGYKKTAFAGF